MKPIALTMTLLGLAAVIAPEPGRAEVSYATTCSHSRGSALCLSTWRKSRSDPHLVPVETTQSDQEAAASREREGLWSARCRPRVVQDDLGVDRFVYAAAGCEFGKFR
jgi:hypothetical protein